VSDTPFYMQKDHQKSATDRLDNIESLLRLALLTASSCPTTQVGSAFSGSQIGTINQYRLLYKNVYQRLIALKIRAEFSAAGQEASIALDTDLTNFGRIDVLVEGGKVTSDVIWLKPQQSLYINRTATSGNLTGALFRVLLFDPLSFPDFLNSSGI
jgi:hypothetical protein